MLVLLFVDRFFSRRVCLGAHEEHALLHAGWLWKWS